MKKVLLLIICCLASCIFCTGGAWGAITCATNATQLQAALTAAASNGEDDLIMVVQGTYTGNFTFSSNEGKNITLQGGYTTACVGNVVNPTTTILDGNNTGQVLYLYNVNGGSVEVDGFTIRHGNSDFSNGGGVYAFSYSGAGTAGAIILTNNIIQGNSVNGSYSGGGVRAESYANSGTANNITLTNNIITGNTSANEGGGVMAYSHSNSGASGAVTFTNNIIAGNTAADQGGGGVYAASSSSVAAGTITITNNTITGNNTPGVSGRGGGLFVARNNNTINVYNNIIWGNTATEGDDIYLFGSGGAFNGYNNDYNEKSGTWDNESGNINANPLFVDASVSNYHLSSTSPCIDAGNNSAPGLPSTDFEGDARIITNSTVDIGADEYLCSNNPFKIGGTIYSYASIHAAYEAMTSGDTMQIHTSEYSEALALDLDKIVTLKGGYNCDFTSNTGYTIVNGSLTISNGTVTIENITIK